MDTYSIFCSNVNNCNYSEEEMNKLIDIFETIDVICEEDDVDDLLISDNIDYFNICFSIWDFLIFKDKIKSFFVKNIFKSISFHQLNDDICVDLCYFKSGTK